MCSFSLFVLTLEVFDLMIPRSRCWSVVGNCWLDMLYYLSCWCVRCPINWSDDWRILWAEPMLFRLPNLLFLFDSYFLFFCLKWVNWVCGVEVFGLIECSHSLPTLHYWLNCNNNCITEHLSTLKFISHLFAQSTSLLISSCSSVMSSGFLAQWHTLVSSLVYAFGDHQARRQVTLEGANVLEQKKNNIYWKNDNYMTILTIKHFQ